MNLDVLGAPPSLLGALGPHRLVVRGYSGYQFVAQMIQKQDAAKSGVSTLSCFLLHGGRMVFKGMTCDDEVEERRGIEERFP